MKLLFAVVLALVSASAAARAQPAGRLSGSIHDQTGAPLPGVRVTIHGATTGVAQTGSAGDFVFGDLPEGDYDISAESSGFQREARAVRVRAGEVITVSLTLRVALLEDAVVTAAKSGERNVQTTPMAVTAISHAELERLGTRTVFQAAALAPSVTLSQNNNFAQLTIRGIGTNVVNAGADPSSAMYLDGVYFARPGMAFVQFLDVERIEVLRGPQGTLYGRNAVGGAINLISRPPTNDVQLSADFTAGNFQELRGGARAQRAPVRDRVMGSVAVARGVRDGYVRDLDHEDHPLGGDNVTTARGQLRVVFDRRTSLLLSSDVDNQNGTPLTFNEALVVKPGFHIDNPPDLHDVRASVEGVNHTRQFGASARVTTALTPSTTLVSLTAYRTLDYDFFVEADTSELDVTTARQRERQHQLSEEITISHERPSLSWVGGVFLFNEYDHQSYWAGQLIPELETRLDPRVDASSRAAFGQATVGLTSRMAASAGVRYTREGKDIDNAGGRYSIVPPYAPVSGSVYGYSDSIAHDAWTPKVGIEMKLPHDAFAYASATRGFKSGGFNLSSPVRGRGYASEWVWSYEGGLKGTLMGGRSRFAVAGFFMDYTNLQVQTPIGIGVFDIRNAAAATIRGVEVEHTSRFGRGLQAGGHVTWLDATYDNYIAVNNSNVAGDVSGNRLNNAPEWAGRLWVEWSGDIGPSRRLSIVADTTAQSTVYYTPFNDNIQFQGPYGLLGTRIEYGPSHRRWTLAAYARNLSNTDYVTATFGTSPVAFGGRPGPPRQFAVDFTVRR